MNQLKVFIDPYIKYECGKMNRFASRGVVLKDDKILLVHLKKTDEYKFPGGGVETDESLIESLRREMLEEAGVHLKEVVKELGYIDQIKTDKYDKNQIFCMRSHYYLVHIEDEVTDIQLSQSEQRLGFRPVWVSINEAINTNKKRIEKGSDYHWTERELWMLEYIKKCMSNDCLNEDNKKHK
jgi:8-oxo-dGTP pyrophosphatase MutT (NUDIX family)